MSRKWIGVAVAVIVVGGTTLAAASLGGGDGPRPEYATVTVDLGGSNATGARPKGVPGGGATKKPKLVYLESTAPTSINPADVAAGGLGPNIDVKLTGCSKVVDGGVIPTRLDVYVQGSYVATKGEYHVLIGLDQNNLADRTPFTISSNLTCLKGVK